MGVISDLLQTLKKLRKVKYGDTVLSSDHNDLVDAVNKLLDLYLPSRIDPTQFVYDPRMFINFTEPIRHDYFDRCHFSINAPSRCLVLNDYIRLVLETVRGINVQMYSGKIAVCFKFTKVQPIAGGAYYDYIVAITLGNCNGYEEIACGLLFYYIESNGRIVDLMSLCDGGSENCVDISPIPNDWTVLVLDTFAKRADVYNRNGNKLASIPITPIETTVEEIDISAETFPELDISPNKLEIDWIVY